MRIEELIGRRIREARLALSTSQRELGERMADFTGRALFPQAVSAAEAGRRDFVAVELLALAMILRRPPAWFLTLDDPKEVVELPGGQELNKGQLALLATIGDVTRERRRPKEEAARLEALAEAITDRLSETQGALRAQGRAAKELQKLATEVQTLARALGETARKGDRHEG